MKSITIKDATTGKKLIKVFHNKEGYFVEARNDVASFDCLIITEDKERITVPIRRAFYNAKHSSLPAAASWLNLRRGEAT